MAYVVERRRSDGTSRFLACYRDPEGRVRSAGTHATRRAAERAAHRDEQKVLAGSWRDAALGAVSFRDYVENSWLPSKHIEPTTKAAYVSNADFRAVVGGRSWVRADRADCGARDRVGCVVGDLVRGDVNTG